MGVVHGGHHVPWVAHEQHHPGLGEGLREQGRTNGSVGLVDGDISRRRSAPGLRAVENHRPDTSQPDRLEPVREEEVRPAAMREAVEIELSEQGADHRLAPDGPAGELPQHPREPRGSSATRPEDPDYARGVEGLGSLAGELSLQSRDLPVLALKPLGLSIFVRHPVENRQQ